MSEEYEIIFITEEGRAIKNNKTGKIYHSEFEIIEEKENEIDRLNNIINGLEKFVKDYIEKYDVPDTDFICAYLRDILDKLKELKEDKC